VNQCLLAKSEKQESRAVARKPRDAAAVLFGLKFADDIHYKFLRVAKLRKPGFRAPNIYRHKTEFKAKWRFKVIQSHMFWSQWKSDKAVSNTKILYNNVGVIC